MLLIDNDALIKLGAWDLLNCAQLVLEQSQSECRRLPSLPYILKRIKNDLLKKFSAEQVSKIEAIVNATPVLDAPIDSTVANALLAIDDIDPGEAALLAALIGDAAASLITGDKRALGAFAKHAPPALVSAAGKRCHCVESLIRRLVAHCGYERVRSNLVTATGADNAIRLCLGSTEDASKESFLQGLASFLKFEGNTLLAE